MRRTSQILFTKREDKGAAMGYTMCCYVTRKKERSNMEWIDRLNRAVEYLEEHLETPDLGGAAKVACCSAYHFQRMFTLLAGVPLSEYIRRRKMSRAAADLQSGEKIVDVALKYGYSSPTAFNRAFQAVHGLPPSAAKTPGAVLKSHPPLRFAITVQGVEEMEYRIEKREAFRIVGVSAPLQKDMEENFQCVPQLWGRAAADGTIPRLAALMDGEPKGLLGVCDGLDSSRYYIAVASSAPAGEGLEEYTVPAFTWAVFPGAGEGAPAVQALERRVVTEWLPTSGYEFAEGPDVEVYLNPECTRFEVWIPVVKAKG